MVLHQQLSWLEELLLRNGEIFASYINVLR